MELKYECTNCGKRYNLSELIYSSERFEFFCPNKNCQNSTFEIYNIKKSMNKCDNCQSKNICESYEVIIKHNDPKLTEIITSNCNEFEKFR